MVCCWVCRGVRVRAPVLAARLRVRLALAIALPHPGRAALAIARLALAGALLALADARLALALPVRGPGRVVRLRACRGLGCDLPGCHRLAARGVVLRCRWGVGRADDVVGEALDRRGEDARVRGGCGPAQEDGRRGGSRRGLRAE